MKNRGNVGRPAQIVGHHYVVVSHFVEKVIRYEGRRTKETQGQVIDRIFIQYVKDIMKKRRYLEEELEEARKRAIGALKQFQSHRDMELIQPLLKSQSIDKLLEAFIAACAEGKCGYLKLIYMGGGNEILPKLGFDNLDNNSKTRVLELLWDMSKEYQKIMQPIFVRKNDVDEFVDYLLENVDDEETLKKYF